MTGSEAGRRGSAFARIGSRNPLRNAQDVYAFVSTHFQKSAKDPGKDERDWAIVTFLIAAQGELPSGGVTADNATSIPVSGR